MKKIIFLCVRYNIRIFAQLFHTCMLLVDILKSRCNLSMRSPVLFAWAKTFVPYIQSKQRLESLSLGLSPNDNIFILGIVEKIQYIAYNNYVDFRILYGPDDIVEQQKYLQYFYAQPMTNYFKKKGYGLVNEYCIKRDMQRLNIILDDTQSILDCGAYIGDSSIAFSDYYPGTKVYAIEPSSANFIELQEVIQIHNKQDDIMPLNVGVGESDTTVYLSDEGIGSRISDIGTAINIKTIDSLVVEMGIVPGLIKRDIEGYEYYSVLGAVNTIKKYKPVLFISVYHHGRDLFEVKKFLQELNVGYKFTFTRRDSMTAFSDTLLVCY